MMRMLVLAAALVAVVGLGAVFFDGKTFTHSGMPQPQAASTELECEAAGGDLNALLAAKRNSPNIARATAEFERGVGECMWGRLAAANVHYREAYRLLRG